MRLTKHKTKKTRKMRNRVYSSIAIVSLAVSLAAGAAYVSPTYTYAKTAKQKRDEAKKNLEDTKNQISGIKDNQATNAADLKKTSEKLNTLLVEQKKLAGDIDNKQTEVDEANKELDEAKKTEAKQYKAMKLRIQYMYENSTDNSMLTAIFESDGLTDMLNRIEYISELYKSDRDLMDAYQAAVQQVTDKTNQLSADLENLFALQDQYDAKQDELQVAVNKLEKQKENYRQQLADAKAQAAEYQKTYNKMAAIVQAQEAAAAHASANNYQGGGNDSGPDPKQDSYLNDSSHNPSQTTNISGADVVAYACQFVGNPYVWGGNSLTNGVDCSGFVHEVYAHFGISTPRFSQAFKYVGQAVSLSNIQAGDVVVYDGHVAIYMGNGCIVEAQSTSAGITNNRGLRPNKVTAVRRLI